MQIVIKKSYFDNIKVAIDAMNKFFASSFKTKAFPVVSDDFQLDRILARTLSWLNNIEPSWIDEPQKAIETINAIKETLNGDGTEADENWEVIMSGANQQVQDQFHAFIGFKVLQFISDHFDQFEALLNGVYSFTLFTTPSQYREAIQLFTSPIPLPEISDVRFPGVYKLFDGADYVRSIFDNDQIKLPEDMVVDTEIQRFDSFTDLQDVEIVVDETVQEAAEINYFTESKPKHIQFDSKSKKFKISKQFESAINKLLTKLRSCETTQDLAGYFSSIPEKDVAIFAENVMPFIYANIFTVKKDKWQNPITENETFQNYAKSYASIVRKNKGAKRFERYDIFSTFKADKEGTIQFLEDFLKLNLVNRDNAVISNSMILTVFNIFDSRIYFDILYNLIPEDIREKDYQTEDGFVKKIRARINQNSRSANPYQKEKKTTNTVETSDQVNEYVIDTLKELGEMDATDMRYCEQFTDAVYHDIDTIGDALYNKQVSQIMIDRYIGESYQLFPELVIQEGLISKLKEKSKKNTINQIEKQIEEHLPAVFIEFIDKRPKKTQFIPYTKGNGCLGVVFSLKDILAALKNSTFGKFLAKNALIMFAEWYDTNDPSTISDDDDPDSIKVLYLNTKDGSIMISQNPFNMDNLFMSDIKPFEESIKSLLTNLEDWDNKPVFEETSEEDEEEEVKIDDDDNKETMKVEDETIETSEEEEDDDDDETIQEQETGDIPTYMKNRINLSDTVGKKNDDTPKPNDPDLSFMDLQLPADVPTNDFEDLADSINARLNTPDANSLGDMLGSGYQGTIKPPRQGGPGTVVYNITYNTNSHNTTTTTTNDLSSGKTTTTITNDLSSHKRTNTGRNNTPSNNYDNTRPSSNSKESNTFSNGKSVQEVFALLDSKEPLFVESDAGTPPKGDLLTTAMDADRETLSKQQKAKRGVQKIGNTVRAVGKPIGRTKQWLRKMVDSFVKRDEDKVKAELVENPSYRSALYKTARIALKAGKFALFNAISPWLGAGYLGVQGLKLADRDRLRKEANDEIATEIQIVDHKIEALKQSDYYGGKLDPEKQQELYKLMRMRSKLVAMSSDANKRKFASTKSVY